MARPATGSVEFRNGAWHGRVTGADGKRVRLWLGDWANSPQGRARAQEVAAAVTERMRKDGLGAACRPAATQDAAEDWWTRYFEHRETLGMSSIAGVYRTNILPVFSKRWADAMTSDCERVRDALDARVMADEIGAKTAFNVWTVFRTASKAASGRWGKKDKKKALQERDDDPCEGVLGPDYSVADDGKQLQWLYPREFIALVECDLVPLEARVLYALATYLKMRGGELKALDCVKVDIERGVVIVDEAYDRERDCVKRTKTGNRGARRYSIEPNLMPLVRKMHEACGGTGRLVKMRLQKYWASDLRKHLKLAGVTRPELFITTKSSKRIRFHDLRATGLTWMSIRGDSPADIQHVAGHTTFDMTRKYIDAGGVVELLPGEVPFPELPPELTGTEVENDPAGQSETGVSPSELPSGDLTIRDHCGGAGNRILLGPLL